MNVRQVSVDEAREFFAHQSQIKGTGVTPDQLHDDGIVYYASGAICGMFHDMPWPKVLGAHCGVKPEGWGQIVPHAKAILQTVWDEYQPELIVAWTRESNRATLAFNKRCGFVVHGQMPTEESTILQHWRP